MDEEIKEAVKVVVDRGGGVVCTEVPYALPCTGRWQFQVILHVGEPSTSQFGEGEWKPSRLHTHFGSLWKSCICNSV